MPPELWVLLTLNINKLPAQEAFLVDAHPSPNHLIGGSRLKTCGGIGPPLGRSVFVALADDCDMDICQAHAVSGSVWHDG